MEVQSASARVKIRLNLSPATVADLLAILEQKKDNVSPKSLKFLLHPGKKPVIEIEPWGILLQEQEHLFEGPQSHTYRIWGRRRLMVLKDILPHASKVELQLLGSGLPSFWSIKSKEIDLDLGLSGWSANDWASQTKFSMMSNTEKVTDQELTRVSAILKQSEGLTAEQIMEKSGFKIKRLVVTNALQQLCSGGRAMFDFHKQIYRWRELFPEALMPKVEERNPRMEKAQELLKSNRIQIDTKENKNNGLSVRGFVSAEVLAPHPVPNLSGNQHNMQLDFNLDGRVVDMECTCYEFKKTSLRKGPCHHLIALMQHIENEAQEIEE